jgi:hypothetical protein
MNVWFFSFCFLLILLKILGLGEFWFYKFESFICNWFWFNLRPIIITSYLASQSFLNRILYWFYRYSVFCTLFLTLFLIFSFLNRLLSSTFKNARLFDNLRAPSALKATFFFKRDSVKTVCAVWITIDLNTRLFDVFVLV